MKESSTSMLTPYRLTEKSKVGRFIAEVIFDNAKSLKTSLNNNKDNNVNVIGLYTDIPIEVNYTKNSFTATFKFISLNEKSDYDTIEKYYQKINDEIFNFCIKDYIRCKSFKNGNSFICNFYYLPK